MPTTILRVAILSPLRKLFDYLPPIDCVAETLQPGARILVPFGKQTKIGIIVAIAQHSDYPLEKLKPADALLDAEPLLPKTVLTLINWASRYYQSPLGEVFETALPNRLKKLKPTLHTPEPLASVQCQKKNSQKLNATLQSANTMLDSPSSLPIPTLNAEQQKALETITQQLGNFKTFLINGVTGSGKTEVYIRLIQESLKMKKQALVLVPEINLTPQLLSRFQARFSAPMAILHSGLTEKQRYLGWERARTGEVDIIIGTRSASFVPLKAPGVFIIDEEHDPSFKQQERFRYHARDVLIMRGSLEHCPVVLGTATPSLETLHNVNTDRFQNLPLPIRAGNAKAPTLAVLDVRHKRLEEGLSVGLLQAMREHLDQKNQVLLFLNRRGFAPVFMCLNCDWMASCQNCDARLIVHYGSKTLKCHHCDTSKPLVKECPNCNHKGLKPIGLGTERLEATLQRHFPNHSIIRIDRDTATKKGFMSDTLQRIETGEANILLGTQMVAKGHHFPNVTLVAILEMDNALFSADFRSGEKLGQLITQAAGRAGREDKPGHVVLQTAHPEHPLLKLLLTKGYLPFADALLTERRAIHLPPFSYQALIRAQAKQIEPAVDFLRFAKTQIAENEHSHCTVLGPVPAPMERRLGKHRAQLLLQSDRRSTLQKLLQALIPKLESHPNSSKVRWSLDIDPMDLY